MSQATVAADPAHGGGHATLRVQGAAAAAVDPRFRLMRDGYEAGIMGPQGWQVGEALLTPLAAEAAGADLVLHLGPDLVDRMHPGTVMLTVPAARVQTVVSWPDIPTSYTGRRRALPGTVETPRDGAIPVKQADPAPVIIPDDTVRATEEHKRDEQRTDGGRIEPAPPVRRAWLAYLLVAALLVAGGGYGGYRWWHHVPPQPVDHHDHTNVVNPSPGPTPPPPVPHHDTPPPRPDATCTSGTAQQVLACHPTPQVLADLGRKFWQGGNPNEGELLLEMAADQGSGTAALFLGGLYDPVHFQPGGPVPHADARMAAKYYRDAARAGESGAAAPRAQLKQWLEHRRTNDPSAAITLEDFWP